jgi:hypothetical protein
MSSPRIIYAPCPDTTPEAEISALASAYKFVLDCHAKKNAAGMTCANGDDVAMKNYKGVSHVDQRTS